VCKAYTGQTEERDVATVQKRGLEDISPSSWAGEELSRAQLKQRWANIISETSGCEKTEWGQLAVLISPD